MEADDMIVVIVGDENDESTQDTDEKKEISVKQEFLDDSTGEMATIEELIETAEKYGQAVEVEIRDMKQEILDEEYIDSGSDEDYVQQLSDEHSEEEYLKVKRKRRVNPSLFKCNEIQRHKMRAPEEQKSFVNELRQEHPELAEDTELLINTLCCVMLDIKRPDPPKDYFVMNNILFECVVCGGTTETLPAASRHYQEKHGPRYLICYACGVDFRSTTNLYKHEKRCSAPDAVIVLKARARTLGRKGRGRPFLVTSDAIRKLKSETQTKKRFPCSYCSAHFSSKVAQQSHEYKHTGERPYRCQQCPAAYTSYCGLARHSLKHTDIHYICDHCGRMFKSKPALVVHLDTHKPLKRFPCEECGRRFAQKMALQRHTDRVHRNLPPPHACQICPRRFPRMSLLKTHMLKEHGMNLITRKMFYRSLPMLTETQLAQARVVFKSELGVAPVEAQPEEKPASNKQIKCYEPNKVYTEEVVETEVEEKMEESIEEEIEEADLSEELMQCIKKLHHKGEETSSRYIVIQNGEAIYVDGSNIDYYKNNLISEVEEECDQKFEESDDEDNKADVFKEIQKLKKEHDASNTEENFILCETSGVVVKPNEGTQVEQFTHCNKVKVQMKKQRKKRVAFKK